MAPIHSQIQLTRDHSVPPVLSAVPAQPATRTNARSALVARAINVLRDHVCEPVTMAELSRLAGASERTLRAAFRDVIGLSPKQYAIAQRLQAARAALCSADPAKTTVTDIATAFGFYELGRFAGRYRNAFGEVPSRTLHHVADWSGEAA